MGASVGAARARMAPCLAVAMSAINFVCWQTLWTLCVTTPLLSRQNFQKVLSYDFSISQPRHARGFPCSC